MLALDGKIRPLYERGIGCRVIGDVLDENPAIIYKRVRKMGIARTKNEAAPHGPDIEVPFSQTPDQTNLAQAAIGTAARWFLRRGYIVSIPIEPTRYDLVVESDNGLRRIQVKTTRARSQHSTSWHVRIGRRAYNAKAQINAGGKRRTVPYTKDDIDLFFIVTGDQDIYIIPVEATLGSLSLGLDIKYANYKQDN